MDRGAKIQELRRLQGQVAELERQLSAETVSPTAWHPKTYYATYHLLAGMVLGFAGAATSLLFNIVGAAMVGKHPLELIRVYLTFPMGESALRVDSGFVLAAGCCLYLITGMFGGIPFHLVLSRFFDRSSTIIRFLAATILGVGVWIVNYYLLLSWLQPALVGGSWIVEQIPLYVAIATHLVFGWTVLLLNQWARFVPYQVPATERLA